MTKQEARSRAAAVFVHLKGASQLFEETRWMNQDDLDVVIGPIADAIFAAAEGHQAPWCKHPAESVSTEDDGHRTCRLCGATATNEKCKRCNAHFCCCAEFGTF